MDRSALKTRFCGMELFGLRRKKWESRKTSHSHSFWTPNPLSIQLPPSQRNHDFNHKALMEESFSHGQIGAHISVFWSLTGHEGKFHPPTQLWGWGSRLCSPLSETLLSPLAPDTFTLSFFPFLQSGLSQNPWWVRRQCAKFSITLLTGDSSPVVFLSEL